MEIKKKQHESPLIEVIVNNQCSRAICAASGEPSASQSSGVHVQGWGEFEW